MNNNNNNNSNNLINKIKNIYDNHIYKAFLVLKLKISEEFNKISNNLNEFKNNINKYNNEFNKKIYLGGLGPLIKIVEEFDNILNPSKYNISDIKLKFLSLSFHLNQKIYNLTSIFTDNINNIMKSIINNNDIYTLKKKIIRKYNNFKNDTYDTFYINFIEDVEKCLYNKSNYL